MKDYRLCGVPFGRNGGAYEHPDSGMLFIRGEQ